ncbi:hypothetical protein HK097_008741 [Rhizophlyctis rosea]|uniref:beta-N-acetylhexosaminidase n=1 Tax=Rhizophlyctis rosea TaxID=64517 RepID=A0AAD5X1I8_9FUNG|nr:hypothetical protein HK097_008741 [Rhizophlyctis rosea]
MESSSQIPESEQNAIVGAEQATDLSASIDLTRSVSMTDELMDVPRRPSGSLASQSFDREDSGTGKDILALPGSSADPAITVSDYTSDPSNIRSPDTMPIDPPYEPDNLIFEGSSSNPNNEPHRRTESIDMTFVHVDNDNADENDRRFEREASAAMSDIILGTETINGGDHTRVKLLLVAERYPSELADGLNEIMRHCVHKNFVTMEGMIVDDQRPQIALWYGFAEDSSLVPGSLIVRSSPEHYSQVPSDEKFEVHITYCRRIEAFRALGRILGAAFALQDINRIGHDMRWEEIAQFETLGAMMDCSRGAVLSFDSVLFIIRACALMGMNTFQLYTEDTYEVKDEPFFGYLRGGYTQEQITSIDNYAYQFGIEVFPCIQTLGHLGQILQWPRFANIRDTTEVLLAKSEETYELIGKLLDAASGPLRSKRIHIGMDEAHGVGEGRYKQIFGSRDSTDVFLEHLQRVYALCQQRNLKPMIWSDMLFTLVAKNNSLLTYYDDKPLPTEISRSLPQGVDLVYWDYYHTQADDYSRKIQHHRDLGYEPWVAGGIWTWNRLYAALPFTLEASRACLQACKRDRVRNLFVTTWGDDGNECDVLSGLPGMLYYAEHGYTSEPEVNWSLMSQNFAGIFGGRLTDWIDASRVDLINDANKGRFPPNLSKWLLWQDPFYAFLSPQYRDMDLERHFSELAENLFRASSQNLDTFPWNERLRFPALLARALALKTNIRFNLAAAHALPEPDRTARLYELTRGPLNDLRAAVDELWRYHRDRIWLDTYMPFGLEILELRYGAVRTRLESLQERLYRVCGVEGGGERERANGHQSGSEGRTPVGLYQAGGGRILELDAQLGEVYAGASVEVVVDFARAYTPSRALGTG